MKILIVEDNPLTAAVLSKRLKKEAPDGSVFINEVGTLQEALHALTMEDYDVCMLDLLLPDTKGKPLDAAPSAVRERFPSPQELEILVVSAHLANDPEIKKRIVDDLRCQFISKDDIASSQVLAWLVFGSRKVRQELAILRESRDPMAEANAANRRVGGIAISVAFVGVIAAICFGKSDIDYWIVITLTTAVGAMIGVSSGEILKAIASIGEKSK